MQTLDEWQTAVDTAKSARDESLEACTYIRKWESFSKPVLVSCLDGTEVVIKGAQVRGKAIVSDQIVGRIGIAISAPVPDVLIVNVPQELVALEPELSHVQVGFAHGIKWIPDCTDREWIQVPILPYNRPRFASLAVLYGLMVADDRQLIYQKQDPRLVFSVDHGHFFPDGINWTETSLSQAAEVKLDQDLVAKVNFSENEIKSALEPLGELTDEIIAAAVAAPPENFPVSDSERCIIAKFIATRRDVLLS